MSALICGTMMLVLLQKALDSPDPQVVEDALSLLVHINALEKTHPRARHEPTVCGRLLASFSLSFDASMLILKLADIGRIREGILLGILMDTQPQPILRPFGQDILVLIDPVWMLFVAGVFTVAFINLFFSLQNTLIATLATPVP